MSRKASGYCQKNDIESEENRRQRLNNDRIRRTNRRNIAFREKYKSGFYYDAQINYSAASETGRMNMCPPYYSII
ncbi:hypothetical protein TNIN_170351 [Trichonephila inaurata madagascariensis]|uniref:Uncharacterized protein n=1 Tax=Trichonephila inaurata madagascariensis TaxID=2747483 RepID=A0A8X6I8W3_9ARAC|nr:hypothetical protein TNIN_170351 [Trichonephila inaurata madagascariensis]